MSIAEEILKSHEKFHINLGLERIEKVLAALGNPQDSFKIIHVAGTNGKGSVSKIINEILIRNGLKVGLYTSPHLFSYEERFRVNGECVTPYVFGKFIRDIDSLGKKEGIELSEFELLTAAAFYYFYFKQVEYVVLETGLGGALDATNIVKSPLVEIITTIDFDHKERLGSTLEEIALQKAGIIKENSKVVVSKDNSGLEVIKKTAQEKQAQVLEVEQIKTEFIDGTNYAYLGDKKVEFNLLGSHQGQNLALALEAIKNLDIEIDQSVIESALKNVKWSFRLEYRKDKDVLIDAAHNPSGIKTLRTFLDENFKDTKKTFVFGCLKHKDYNSMLDILVKDSDELYFVEFDYPNSLKLDELDGKYNAKKLEDIDEVLQNEGIKVFCGSIYMLGSLLKTRRDIIGRKEELDF